MEGAAVMLLLNIVFFLIWTLVDPMVWTREEICGSGDQSSYGYCRMGQTNVSVSMSVMVLIVNFAVAALAASEAYKARRVRLKLNESRYIFAMLVGLIQVGSIGAPLVAVAYTSPVASYLVK